VRESRATLPASRKVSSGHDVSEGELLADRVRVSYNPKVFRTKAIPGRRISGCTGSRKLRLAV
jgi:hypothetical protein